MRIHSKFSDYYDSALAYGADETLHFVRHTQLLDANITKLVESFINTKAEELGERIDKYKPYSRYYDYLHHRYGYGAMASLVVIGMCGKLYGGYRIGNQCVWPTQRREAIIEACKSSMSFRDETLEERLSKPGNFVDRISTKINTLSKIDATQLHLDLGVPYFVYGIMDTDRKYHVVGVPCLKEFSFQKMMDPYTAMQELSMFIGGVMPRQTPEMINISDKDRIAQHGFDKFSFKHPIKL